MKTGTIAFEKETPKYMIGLDDCLREMSAIRKNMKKWDSEIRRLETSTRRKLNETKAIISRVQATL